MDRRGDRGVEVVLLEDGLDDADVVAPPQWRPLAARVPRRAWAVVAAVAALGVAGWSVAGRLEEAARDERLARVEGLSVPLSGPLGAQWRVPGDAVVAAVGGDVLVQGPGGRGVRAVEVATGAVRYEQSGACQVVGSAAAIDIPGLGVREAAEGDVLLCVDMSGTGDEPGQQAPVATAHVHRPSSGALLRTIDLGPSATFAPVGTDVVSIGVGADGQVAAGRWSLLTGEQRWRYRSPVLMPRTDAWRSSVDETFVRLEVGGWSLTLDTATGERVGRSRWGGRPGDGAWGPTPLADGGSAVSRFTRSGTETTVSDATGAELYTVPGFLLSPVVDDGTAPGTLLLVRADSERPARVLASVDARDGRTRWESTVRLGQIAVLSEQLVVRDPGGLTALDVQTGAVRWSAPSGDRSSGWGLATDGRRVLTLDTVRGRSTLTARDVDTGRQVWTAPAPLGDASLVLLPNGTVLAVGSRELVAMRP